MEEKHWYAPWREKQNHENPEDNWYAVFVVTGEEEKVRERIKYRFKDRLNVIVPKRKLRERKEGVWHDIVRVLFPGYVLLNGAFGISDYYNLKGVPGLLKLLRDKYEPLKIRAGEIEIIRKLTYNEETIGFSDVLIENGIVKVTDGPLMSMEGQIVSIDRRKGRAKVNLNFLGEQRTVELGINILQNI